MKIPDFQALPEGTVVLLRPRGHGSREPEAVDRFVLATLGPQDLIEVGTSLAHLTDPPSWVPGGYGLNPNGTQRAAILTLELPSHIPDGADHNWRDLSPGQIVRTALRASDIIGPWDAIRDNALASRRIRVTNRLDALAAKRADDAAKAQAHQENLAILRPAVLAAGLHEHRLFKHDFDPDARVFTVTEVLALLHANTTKDNA